MELFVLECWSDLHTSPNSGSQVHTLGEPIIHSEH